MPDVREPRRARLACALLGLALLVVGVIGLAQTGLSGWSSTPVGTVEETASGLGGSTLLNIVHVILGVLALVAAMLHGARLFGLFGILAFIALIAYDTVALIADEPGDPLGIRWPAVVVHAVGLVASIYISGEARREVSDRPDQAR